MFDLNSDDTSVRRRVEQTLRPLIVPQMLKAAPQGDGPMMIDGMEVNLVNFIGCVVSVNETNSHISIKVHDRYAAIEVRMFTNAGTEEGNQRMQEMISYCRLNEYVRVVGNLKQFSGTKNVQGFSIKPVTDYNEVIMHIFEVVQHHLELTRTKLTQPMQSMLKTHLTKPLHNAIVEVLCASDANNRSGLNPDNIKAECSRKLQRIVTEAEFNEELQFLVAEGHVYEGDQGHYCYPH